MAIESTISHENLQSNVGMHPRLYLLLFLVPRRDDVLQVINLRLVDYLSNIEAERRPPFVLLFNIVGEKAGTVLF